MSEFALLFRSDEHTFDILTSDEVQHFNRSWRDWWARGIEEGWLLDASRVLVAGTDVARGYVNVASEDLDSAVELAKGCPVLQHGGRVEVRPYFETHPGE